jgi:ketosteroid isomerase-like protein
MSLLMACNAIAQESDLAQLQQQVEDTERAFAATMADRDHEAFRTFLSEETIFFAGESPLRGSQQVADAWEPYFQETEAPFSWESETIVVLDSGTLALSSGPVRDPAGNTVARFNSIWRLDPQGQWKIVFDKGSRVCDDPSPANGD